MTKFERRLAIIGTGVAVITAALFYVQLNEMNKQTQILASQSEGANAGGLMDQMNTRKQLAIAQQQATAANQQVAEIRRQTRLSERAWLSVNSIRLVTLEVNQPAYVEADLLNTGKTVTENGMSEGSIYMPEQELTSFEHYKNLPPRPIPSIFPFPANPGILPFTTDEPINEAMVKQVMAGSRFLYVWSEITYRDTFGPEPHHLCFCGRYVPKTRRFEACRHYKACAD